MRMAPRIFLLAIALASSLGAAGGRGASPIEFSDRFRTIAGAAAAGRVIDSDEAAKRFYRVLTVLDHMSA